MAEAGSVRAHVQTFRLPADAGVPVALAAPEKGYGTNGLVIAGQAPCRVVWSFSRRLRDPPGPPARRPRSRPMTSEPILQTGTVLLS
ncbi:hypothetical protein A33M_4166 [Rhodovulum sp. PH10]|nr:hypothetical protein A33M_4166 [Rhodovulum sp. PH10]